ncbi:MAG: peptidylprolyl isomerase [Chitinophagaceae bacterium]|nr:peptidylprolyl isomerase [Chitinophagaceae bacterium]
MKICCWLFLIYIGLVQPSNAQNLFQYGPYSVSKNEFVSAYKKNNTIDTVKDKTAAIQQYLDLYIKFKLKVQDALDLHLDKLIAGDDDVQQFRKQIEEPYLTDQKELEKLAEELFRRSQVEIRVSHIFIPNSEKKSAKILAQQVYNKIKAGEDFGKLALEFSGDPYVASNNGDLGYITALNLPYNLENIVFNLPLNGVSSPFESSIGYHIFKKTGIRNANGKFRIAQILVAAEPQNGNIENAATKKLADSLYNLLKKGASFTALATQFSVDQASAARGGELLNLVGTGDFESVFMEAIFSLKKDGDISTPLATGYGYHIIKRLEQFPVPTTFKGNETYWKKRVESSSRMAMVKASFEKKLLAATSPNVSNFDKPSLWRYTDTFMKTHKKLATLLLNDSTTLISFDEEKIKTIDWINYIIAINPTQNTEEYKKLWEPFIQQKATAYYRKHLEQFDANYRQQLREFMEGNLLFEVMGKRIWTRASEDSVGLKEYFSQHKSNYNWKSSADVLMISAVDSTNAIKAKNAIDSFPEKWKTLIAASDGSILADSSRMDLDQINVSEKLLIPNTATPIVINPDLSATFFYILKTYPKPAPKSFEEARGLVVNDYQILLEDKWINTLKKKYPVKINKPLFKSVIKELR